MAYSPPSRDGHPMRTAFKKGGASAFKALLLSAFAVAWGSTAIALPAQTPSGQAPRACAAKTPCMTRSLKARSAIAKDSPEKNPNPEAPGLKVTTSGPESKDVPADLPPTSQGTYPLDIRPVIVLSPPKERGGPDRPGPRSGPQKGP